MTHEDSVVLLYRAVDARQASLMVQALTSAGIEATQSGGLASIGFGDLPADAQHVEIWVNSDVATRAKEVIVAHQAESSTEATEGPDWVCPACGEDNAVNFQVCWKCQTERPAK